MWIKCINLVNWRAYDKAVFNIPYPSDNPQSKVVIIGAENGKGKTSLLEAITLCLFGERGVATVVRADNTVPNPGFAYKGFLESAFCRFAESTKASVEIIFETGGEKEISVKRVWHFSAQREFREDELRIHENGKALRIPAMMDSEQNRQRYLAGYIAREFMPHTLSPFFLFDGAQVQRMAQRHMKKQVQEGIEGILGIPIIRDLANDLDDYAKEQRRQGMAGGVTNANLRKLERKIEDAETKSNKLAKELEDTVEQLKQAGEDNEALLKKFQEIGGDNVAKYGELREKLGKLEQFHRELFNQLNEVIVREFAMSLVGQDMLVGTVDRLRKERARVEWEHSKNSGGEKYDKFVGNLEQRGSLSPPLTKEQSVQLYGNIKSAWDDVWYPMPDDCADDCLNPGFSDDECKVAVERLGYYLSASSDAKVKGIRASITQNDGDIRRLKEDLRNIDGTQAGEAKQLSEQLKENLDKIRRLEGKKGACSREKEAVDKELAHIHQEFARETNQMKGNAPYLVQSNQAKKTGKMIRSIVSQAYSEHVEDIAQGMTSAYLNMAHKENISKIKITNECDIELLTQSNRDVRDLDLSHGESEIFSLALIAAIVRVSKNRFPLIIDTPLANLDHNHRRNFLSYFSSHVDNQVLFLSTNEEIREEQMSILQDRIACKFLIEQELEEDYRRNVVRAGKYFYGAGA